jgi:amino acid adenylation domain-containing protein
VKNVKSREEGNSYPAWSSFIRPFDLSHTPLLRVGTLEAGESRDFLFVDMHHIISDGISMQVLREDFMAFVDGKELPLLRVQYKDFSEWQNGENEKEILKRQEEYWLKEFEDEITVLELPTDYPRPITQSFEGEFIDFGISAEETRRLNEFAFAGGFTLFMILAAAFNILLSKLSGQQDIIIGTPVAGRRHADLENIIGMFVNTLALRNYPASEKTFIGFLSELKKRTLEAFENQDYQFEYLVEKVSIYRDIGRNPLFDVMLVLQNFFSPSAGRNKNEDPTGLPVDIHEDYEDIGRTAKFDLTLFAFEKTGKLGFSFQYCTKLFRRESIERFIVYFRKILSTVIDQPDTELSQIKIISEEEKRRILFHFNDTSSDYPRERTIHQLFEWQVEKAPDHIAIHGSSVSAKQEPRPDEMTRHITYRELNHLSNRLRDHLKEKGVFPGSIVGIMANRSLEVIIGILGILKAGGAYLPLEPDFPEDRKNYMLADSGAKVLLTAPELLACIGNDNGETFLHSDAGIDAAANLSFSSPRDLAYIIYTSGSTGRPKGVMAEHRNVIRLVINNNYVEFSALGRVLQTGALSFDASTFEIWGPLLNGAELVLLPKERLLDPEKLKSDINIFQISTMWMTAPLFNQMMDADEDIFTRLQNLLVGGDVLSPFHINRLLGKAPELNIVNGYGPTENTTFSTTLSIREEYRQNIPIGQPIANSSAYIVDTYNRLQPVGVVGELLVGGDGVSRGYLNNPELTADKFGYFDMSYGILYRTGDLARWLSDGTVEFLGRTDHQVKIRGFRIELGEIESQLKGYAVVREAVVVSREDSKGDKYLCAYIVSEGEFEIGGIREYLSGVLPDYMIPSYFVRLDRIPLNPNGKIALKELPEPELDGAEEYAGPVDEIESRLV